VVAINWEAEVTDQQTPEELAAHYGHGGPVEMANAYMYGILELGDYAAVWPLCDDNLRLVAAQSWLWANREHPVVARYDRDAAAAGLANDGPAHPLWEAFAVTTLDEHREAWAGVNLTTIGAASRPRPIGTDLELLIFLDTGGEAIVVQEPTLIDNAILFIMRSTPTGWRVAAIGDRLYEPGWPPELADGDEIRA
jgi:hypothetical protein